MNEVTLQIDGRVIKAKEDMTVLQAAAEAGVKIPTLCYHESVSPFGSCRLCMVEVKTKWRTRLVTSCVYPVEEGLVVNTKTPEVMKIRKMVLEMLLARCPDAKVLQDLARQHGVDTGRLKKIKNDDCILCGLCTRICQERMGRSVQGFVGRGIERDVGTPFGRASELCMACGACAAICPTGRIKLDEISVRKPIPLLSEFNQGLCKRAPIYVPFPQAVPSTPVIDREACVHFVTGECGICKDVCKAGAINYDQKDEVVELEVGSIILSPGYQLYDPKIKPELGYGRFPNVLTALDFERVLAPTGPFGGNIVRPCDGKHPHKIAFIQCVGSREVDINYCSAVCCMYATKQAILIKEDHPDIEVTIFFIDMRAVGKGYEAFYERAKKMGIRYIRFKPSYTEEVPGTRDLRIRYFNEAGETVVEEFNMVVLSAGMGPAKGSKELAEKLGVSLNEFGFCQTEMFNPVETSKEGVYSCGLFNSPKDISESVTQASAAVVKALSLLSKEKGTLVKEKVYPPERDVVGLEPRIGVFICHCGKNIASIISVLDVVDYAKTLPNVEYAENLLYACSADSGERMKQIIHDYDLNRLIVASCTPRTHEPLFQENMKEAGLNAYLFEMANIRDQCSWVHTQDPAMATKKSKDIIKMAVAKARLREPLYPKIIDVNHNALVVGGGVAGMTAALDLANQGFETYLLEQSDKLGGNLRRLKYLLDGQDPQKKLEELVQKVQSHPKIKVYMKTEILKLEGSVADFSTEFRSDGQVHTVKHGAIIIATGADEYKPEEYLYGQNEKVMTQLELEDKLSKGEFDANTVVMIQCVGSREEARPYCSRVCCSQAVKNALVIKETKPEANVFVLYRDLRTYSFNEQHYYKAREKGVRFVRYEDDKKPQVSADGDLAVRVYDPMLDADVVISPDLVVLSAGTVAGKGNKALSEMLRVPLNQDNFFLEAHLKLRPVDFPSEGIFLCGTGHAPKSIEETIAQASAAAARASTVLSKNRIQSEATVSYIDPEVCRGCGQCVAICAYGALELDGLRKIAVVNETLCQGCGACAATCPSKAIRHRNWNPTQFFEMIEAAGYAYSDK